MLGKDGALLVLLAAREGCGDRTRVLSWCSKASEQRVISIWVGVQRSVQQRASRCTEQAVAVLRLILRLIVLASTEQRAIQIVLRLVVLAQATEKAASGAVVRSGTAEETSGLRLVVLAAEQA